MKKKCPIHGNTMSRINTRFGGRWNCVIEDCTVVCWDGATSTPADAETRLLRQECHLKFDARFPARRDGYRWMSHAMNISGKQAHIGMFDADQCRQLLRLLAEPTEA